MRWTWTICALVLGCAEATLPDEAADALTSMVEPPPLYDARVRLDFRATDAMPANIPDAEPPDPTADARVIDAQAADAGDTQGVDARLDDAGLLIDAQPIPDMSRVDAAPMPDPDAGCAGQIEQCNGADDDCDGTIDEGADCGLWIARHCRLGLGWADGTRQPRGPQPNWAGCPAADRSVNAGLRCVMTRRDEAFMHLDLDGDVDENDQFGLQFDCADPDLPELAAYVPTHCAAFLGWADNERGVDNADSWGGCPGAVEGGGLLRCTSSGFDRRFRAMQTAGDVDGNDDFGIAFVCRDPGSPARATALQSSVEVQLAWASGNRGPADGAASWTARCPASEEVGGHPIRCATSSGDGRFHQLDLERDINSDDDLGIALKAL